MTAAAIPVTPPDVKTPLLLPFGHPSPEQQAFPSLPYNPELLALLTGALSSSNIQKFQTSLLRQQDSEPSDFLQPQTLAKSFTMLGVAVKLLCGGPCLTETHGFMRYAATETVKKIQDVTYFWNKRAVVGENKSEAFQLRKSVYQTGPIWQMRALSYLQVCESFGFKAVLERGQKSILENTRRLTAFTYLSVILARPATRAGVYLTTTLSQLDTRAQQDGYLVLLFEHHKTAKSYGVLACQLPPWCVEIWASYLSLVRPALVSQKQFVTTGDEFAFPKRTNEYLQAYLESILGPHNLSASHVRNLFCEDVAALSKGSPFFSFRQDLQLSAAHEACGATLKHYTVSAKLARERLLCSFTNYRLVLPALEQARQVILRGAQANLYDFSPPPQKPVPKVFPSLASVAAATSPESPESKTGVDQDAEVPDEGNARQCANARKKKRSPC